MSERVVLEVAKQRIRHHRPCVALVGYEGEGGGQGRDLATGRVMHDGAKEGRRMRESGGFRQEAGDLHIRLLATAQPPVELENEEIAVDDGDIRLLGAERPRLAEVLDRLEGVAGPESDLSVRGLEPSILTQGAQQGL